MTSNKIRTLLIDDSAFMRKVIGDVINNDDSLELVGIAHGGRSGCEMALKLKPDVVITDMVMPDFDGMYVVKTLLKQGPMPIIILSSLDKGNTRIFEALQEGAFEFIDKPSDMESVREGKYRLAELVRAAARSDISVLKAKQLDHQNSHAHTFKQTTNYDVVIIGASTGGPSAVESVVNNLPKNLNIPVIVVQHMPPRFLETFAVRLNENSPIPVKLARKGGSIKGGIIYLACGESNMRIENNITSGEPMFTFTKKVYKEYNSPSIDCLFESVASFYGARSIGVILTGMGRDGTMGLGKIKKAGGFTIAQDEKSSVVYGMPKSAFDEGTVKQVVRLNEIPGFIVSCL
jgi:two-component system chemotaxis response regulator CheB